MRLVGGGGVSISGEAKVGVCEFSIVTGGSNVWIKFEQLTRTVCGVLGPKFVLRSLVVSVEI